MIISRVTDSALLIQTTTRNSGFPTRYRAARFNGIKSNSQGSLICLASCLTVSARSNLSWAKYERFKQTDLRLIASILFRIRHCLPSNTDLYCNFCHGVLIVSVLVLRPDKTRQEVHGKQGHMSRIQRLQKKCLSLLEINSSQRDAAICSAALAQSGTDVMVSLMP